MKTLPIEFTKHGFHHKQIAREGMNAIYERHKPGQQKRHFEVIRIGSHNGFELGGVHIEPAETYPSAEQWGAKAWTCQTQADAEKRLQSL